MASTANIQFSWAASTTPGVTNQTLTVASGSGSGLTTITGVNLPPSSISYNIALPANTPITATLNAVIMNGTVALISPPVVVSFNTGPVNPPNSPSNFNYQIVSVS